VLVLLTCCCCSFSERWVRDHVNVIKDPKYGMGNIPLVLQEYNLSHPNDSTRTQLFQSVSMTKQQ
jgi:hypothetical protein